MKRSITRYISIKFPRQKFRSRIKDIALPSLSETDLILGETTVNAELVLKAGLLVGAGGEVLVDLKRWNPCMATHTLFIFFCFYFKEALTANWSRSIEHL